LKVFVRLDIAQVSFRLIGFLNLLLILLLIIFLLITFGLLIFEVLFRTIHKTGPVYILYILLHEIRIRLQLTH
jgi:hypothetical protein